MFVTIWMCTHEWSLISIRTTAFTFETSHQPLICGSLLTLSITLRSFLFARTGTRMRICAIASDGLSLVSRSASAETGWSIRFSVSGSICIPSSLRRSVGRPVAVQRQVEAACREQLVVRALLDDPAVLQDDDQVGVADRREPVGDDEGRAAVQKPPQRALDLSFRADVDGARRLVEDQDLRVREQRPRERDQLTLAERQPGTAFAELRLVAILEALDELVGADGARSGLDVLSRRAGAAERDVLDDRSGEEESLLRDDAELPPQRRLRGVAKIGAVDRDAAVRRVVEAREQLRDRRLPRAGVADESDRRAGRDIQVDSVQHLRA